MSKIIIIAGPSGVGKGTIEKELFKDKSLKLAFSISATTRPKRAGEIDKKHYFFISEEEFIKKIDSEAFIEWSQHFDNYYGTLYEEVNNKISDGYNVLIEVDTIGAINIIEKYKSKNQLDKLISIFIAPPSLEELEKRILERNTEDLSSIKNRMEKAKIELKETNKFMFCVINDKINKSIDEIKQIIKNNGV
ncbi:MAG: guanylate kinase [Metamycoplasmataceae bacterium]